MATPSADRPRGTRRRRPGTVVREATLATGEAPAWQPTIKDLPLAERPRERLAEHGPTALATHELLAIILRSGTPGRPVTQVAQDLLVRFGGLSGLARAPLPELCRLRGLGLAKATELKAVFELARRLHLEQPEERVQVCSPADVARLVQLEMAALEHEQFRIFILDTKNRVLAARKLYDGTVSSTQVRVGEVFREVVRYNGVAVVAAHNHPSGDPTPSPDDIALTEALVAAGRLLDVEVLDHIIIGHGRWTSMRERRLGF
jgi:DNA repair protein RadC